MKVPCHHLIYLPSFFFCSLCSFLFSLFSLFSCKVAWGALGHVSNKGQLGPGSQAEAESSGTGGGGGGSSRGGGGRRRSHPPGDTTDAFQAFAVDSDTTDDDEEEEEEIIQGVRLLPRTASTLGLRVKTPPVITDKTLLQELRQEGGADPHPSTTSIQIRANAPPPLPGVYTPRPGSNNGKRQAVFPTEFTADSEGVTQLGAITVLTPSYAEQRAHARQRGQQQPHASPASTASHGDWSVSSTICQELLVVRNC